MKSYFNVSLETDSGCFSSKAGRKIDVSLKEEVCARQEQPGTKPENAWNRSILGSHALGLVVGWRDWRDWPVDPQAGSSSRGLRR